MIKKFLVFCFLLDNVGRKRQKQFKGIRYNTIKVKNTKFDVNVSELQNPVDFYD